MLASLATPNSIGPANISYNESVGQLDPRFNNPGADLFQYDPDFGWVIVTEEGAICGGGAQWLGNPDPDVLAFLLAYSFALGPCGYHQFTPEQKDAAIAALAAKNRANYVSPAGFADASTYRPYGIAAAGALAQALGLAPHDLEWASVYTIQGIGPVNNLGLQDRFTFEWLMNHFDLWKYPKVVDLYNQLLPKWDAWSAYEVKRVDDSFHIMDLVSAISWGWGIPFAISSAFAAAGAGAAEAAAGGAASLEAPAEAAMLEAVSGESSILTAGDIGATVGTSLDLSQAIDVAKIGQKIVSTLTQDSGALPTIKPLSFASSAGATAPPPAPSFVRVAATAAPAAATTASALTAAAIRYVTDAGRIVASADVGLDTDGALIDSLTGEPVTEQAAPAGFPWWIVGAGALLILLTRRRERPAQN